MIVAYQDGKMIVKHQSGYINTYDKSHYEKQLAREQARAAKLQAKIAEIENTIKAIDNSVKSIIVASLRSRVFSRIKKMFS